MLRYVLLLPADYRPSHRRRWPLLLFLHGAGERGNDPRRVLKHGPVKMALRQPGFPFVIVAPQCPAGRTWSNGALIPLLDAIITRHNLDPRRVYLTGLSMGGAATWSLGCEQPQRFAAIAPICGGGEPLTVQLSGGASRRALRRLPVWAFHGARDRVVPPQRTHQMIRALRTIGNRARLTVYPRVAHDSWTRTYASPKLYTWLLGHTAPGLRRR
jgi:predicted peptidase